MAQVELPLADEPMAELQRSPGPLPQLAHGPEVHTALVHGDAKDPDRFAEGLDLETVSRAAGDQVHTQPGIPAKLLEQMAAGVPGAAAQRWELVAQHQDADLAWGGRGEIGHDAKNTPKPLKQPLA